MDDCSLQQLGCTMLHNAYDRPEWLDATTGRLDLAAIYGFGMRGIELDLVKAPNGWEWCVRHGGDFAADRLLSAYLDDLRRWQEVASPDHEPLVVCLDLKGRQRPENRFPEEFDGYLAANLGDARRFAPHDVLIWPGDLMQTLMAQGWPALGKLRGKIILMLSGDHDGTKLAYARSDPRARLCFADTGSFAIIPSDGGERVILNDGWHNIRGDALRDVTTWALARRAILTRVYYVDAVQAWRAAAARVNIVATDNPDRAPAQGWWRLARHPAN